MPVHRAFRQAGLYVVGGIRSESIGAPVFHSGADVHVT